MFGPAEAVTAGFFDRVVPADALERSAEEAAPGARHAQHGRPCRHQGAGAGRGDQDDPRHDRRGHHAAIWRGPRCPAGVGLRRNSARAGGGVASLPLYEGGMTVKPRRATYRHGNLKSSRAARPPPVWWPRPAMSRSACARSRRPSASRIARCTIISPTARRCSTTGCDRGLYAARRHPRQGEDAAGLHRDICPLRADQSRALRPDDQPPARHHEA